MYEPLRIVNLAPIEVEVSIDDKPFVVREASEGASVEYRNLMMASTRFDSNMKPTGIDGMASAEPLLVSRCLFEKIVLNKGLVDEKVTLRPVPETTIRSWPSRVVQPIFDMVKKISNIGEGEAETEESLTKQLKVVQDKLEALRLSKNSSPSTGDTSD